MNWIPNDLVADADLEAYESAILTAFNRADWTEKRRRALEDWLAPILKTSGFDLERLRTRFDPASVLDTDYTELLASSTDETADDLNLATLFATPATDAVYVGSTQVFRGLSIRMLDSASAVTATLTVKYWNDTWTTLVITDGTQKTLGKSFSGGGSVTWDVPTDWVPRPINASDPRYWVKLTMSATPTGATAGQLGVIRRSVLCAPATLRTLALIMHEAPTGGPGPWAEKAAWYETEADAALQRALPLLGGEFDTDVSGQLSAAEAAQTAEEVLGHAPFRLERA